MAPSTSEERAAGRGWGEGRLQPALSNRYYRSLSFRFTVAALRRGGDHSLRYGGVGEVDEVDEVGGVGGVEDIGAVFSGGLRQCRTLNRT